MRRAGFEPARGLSWLEGPSTRFQIWSVYRFRHRRSTFLYYTKYGVVRTIEVLVARTPKMV